ncbi:MAG: ankyrin repeat domain-containing protein [Vicinamibacteraceae bacterium]
MAEPSTDDRRIAFIAASTWHGSLDRAETMLAAHPDLVSSDIHIAAILGDDAAVRAHLARDPSCVSARSEPYGADALTHLCLSKYLRLDPARTDAFLAAATALLDAGADPNGGFWTSGEDPEHETPLYGAAGVAHHATLTRLLLERGADPNDGEAVYHSPETDDNAALQALVETGRLTSDSLSMMLLRKHDWHDCDGAMYLLEHGADANAAWGSGGRRPLHHALARSNRLAMIELLLDHGADPTLTTDDDDLSGIARAAREGRRDVLQLFAQRGVSLELPGVDGLIAACALDDTIAVQRLAQDPALAKGALAMGGDLLARFAGNGNAEGVRQLLDLGVDVASPFQEGDGYFAEPPGSLAIHVAAWRAQPAIVKLLLYRDSPVDRPDPKGRTPLALAIKACVDSYWAHRRTPESVEALLRAGASPHGAGVQSPSGYAEVDDLLGRYTGH